MPRKNPKFRFFKSTASAPDAVKPLGAMRPPDGAEWVSLRQAAAMLSVSQATIWRWLKYRPGFPRPRKLSAGCTRLNLAELRAFLASLGGE